MDWSRIFLGTGFEPHGTHFYNTPWLLWTSVSANALTAFAYLAISAGILYFMYRRTLTEYHRLYPIFAGFIFLCALAHMLHIVTMWYPIYIPEAFVDAITGIVSVISAAVIWYFIPQALRIPSLDEYAQTQSELILKEREIKMQKMKNEHRKDFVSMMGHELKTPITSQLLFVEMLHRQALSDGLTTYAEHLETMRRQSNKLTKLVNDMLEVMRIEGGKMQFHFEPMDLWAAVREAAQEVAVTATHHRIKIKGTIRKKVRADHDRIMQVLSNLLINAVKYSPNANRIVVKVAQREQSALVCVQDFGIGIDAPHQEKVFDQFYRVDEDSKDAVPGMGVGLYISSEIIRQHKGRMWVESEKGKGSTFCFMVPYA